MKEKSNMNRLKASTKNNDKKGEMPMKLMRKQFIELLNIHAVSRNEKPVRDYLLPIMEKKMDSVGIDAFGNLLAEKKIGTGKGATVLLSAHMDTVTGVVKDRMINEKNGIFSSSVGALGADDRAGIAIILAVLRNLPKVNFDGVVKVSFSVEEEIGAIGASKISEDWLADVDLALVVDRKGNRDIVVGCGMPFCSNEVGKFLEDCSKLADMSWKCVEGGVSDAMEFANKGINAVNLSAGYYNEHTNREFCSIIEMKDTVRFIMQIFGVINEFYEIFTEVPSHENHWVKSWYKGDKYNVTGDYGHYYTFDDGIYAEEFDTNGDVFVYELGANVVIVQDDQEIMLTRESLKGLMSQIQKTLS